MATVTEPKELKAEPYALEGRDAMVAEMVLLQEIGQSVELGRPHTMGTYASVILLNLIRRRLAALHAELRPS